MPWPINRRNSLPCIVRTSQSKVVQSKGWLSVGMLLNLISLGDYRIPLQAEYPLDYLDEKSRSRIPPLKGKSMCCDFPFKIWTYFVLPVLHVVSCFTCITCCQLFYLYYILSAVLPVLHVGSCFTCFTCCQLFVPVLHVVSCLHLQEQVEGSQNLS